MFLPAGFDSPNLIEQLCKAAKIASLDPSGNLITFEDVLRPPQNNLSKGMSTLNGFKSEAIDDWNLILHAKFTKTPLPKPVSVPATSTLEKPALL